jgi:hypothetical protein
LYSILDTTGSTVLRTLDARVTDAQERNLEVLVTITKSKFKHTALIFLYAMPCKYNNATTCTAATFVSLLPVLVITSISCFVPSVSAAASAAVITPVTSTGSLGQQAISAVMGESAVVDKETGRIFWEGGSSNTLVESIAPKLRSVIGIPHMKATLLSVLLLLAVAGTVSQLVRDWLQSILVIVDPNTTGRRSTIQMAFLSIIAHALILLPKAPRWFILLVLTLYLIEAYTCSTHRYLLHVVDDAETYIEQLREQLPIVEWKVRSFHFENYIQLPFKQLRQLLRWSSSSVESQNEVPHDLPSFPSLFHWKRVTHSATGYYNYTSCTDQTIVGVWKRAPIIMSYNPPPTRPSLSNESSFQKNSDNSVSDSTTPTTRNSVIIPITKMVITKTLLLRDTKTRQDYFTQQKAFLRQEHPDEYAEFSTNVYMNGLTSSRVLALLPSKSLLNSKNNKSVSHPQRWLVHRYTYWFFTCIGFTVPYRRWLASQCDEVRVRIVKETSMDKSTSSAISASSNGRSLGTGK